MFEAVEDKKIGIRPLRFMVACVLVAACFAMVLNLRRIGLVPVLRVGTPAAALAVAVVWLKADDWGGSRNFGNGVLAFMCAASIADVIWSVFFP